MQNVVVVRACSCGMLMLSSVVNFSCLVRL